MLDVEAVASLAGRERRSPARREIGIPAVDLVVLIESSEAMKDLADTLSKVVGAALGAARLKRPASLRVTYLGTETAFPRTIFMISARGYLTVARRVDGSLLASRPSGPWRGEPGGRSAGVEGSAGHALVDVLAHFDWRPGATRNVLFLGDGPLDGARSRTPAGHDEGRGVAGRVIEAARQMGARVHMCPSAGRSRGDAEAQERRRAGIEAEYARVAVETGGQFFVAQDSLGACLTMLEGVISGSTTAPRISTAAPTPR
ncbi:hypothetical protein WMF04_12755 [Sorangium sp. So ce260]|uniref:hypothetical protein n=1 Tax=Sorangium sp. So ce260 TaxID=3133291 RepID=UPI003F5EEB48